MRRTRLRQTGRRQAARSIGMHCFPRRAVCRSAGPLSIVVASAASAESIATAAALSTCGMIWPSRHSRLTPSVVPRMYAGVPSGMSSVNAAGVNAAKFGDVSEPPPGDEGFDRQLTPVRHRGRVVLPRLRRAGEAVDGLVKPRRRPASFETTDGRARPPRLEAAAATRGGSAPKALRRPSCRPMPSPSDNSVAAAPALRGTKPSARRTPCGLRSRGKVCHLTHRP